MKTPGHTDFAPVLCSAFAFPGAGQFLQKRRLAGVFFGLTVTLFFVLTTCLAVWPWLYNLAFVTLQLAGPEYAHPMAYHGSWIFGSLGLSLALHAWNILDAWRAMRRAEHIQPAGQTRP